MPAVVAPTPMSPTEHGRRGLSSGARFALSIGLVAAGALVAYGLSESVDASRRGPIVPPAIAVVEGPATATTAMAVTAGSVPGAADLNVPTAVTADVALPPVAPQSAP